MKTIEEFRKYFIDVKPKELETLLNTIYTAQGAAYADHNLSPQIDAELRNYMANIAGLSEEDRKKLIDIADEYSKELQSEAKDKRPYAVPIKKKKSILLKLLFGTAVISGTVYILKKILKNGDEE